MANGVDKLARTDWARQGFRANRSSAASGSEKNRFSCKVRRSRKGKKKKKKKRTERSCPDGLLRLDIQTRRRVKVNRQKEVKQEEEEGWIAVKLESLSRSV